MLRADAAASTASRLAFVTIAIRPSCRDETAREEPLIWGKWEAQYIYACDWTTQIRLNLLGKLNFARTADGTANSWKQAY
jgi:hypothetical protein